MFVRHHDLTISKEDPFASCQLGRRKYADVLTQIVDEPGAGFVLAINNEWGTGKTTFVKMWQQQLQNSGFTTLYFNAWENDFERNPLAAIMSELKILRQRNNEKTFKSLLKKGAILTKNILPALAKGVANRYIDSDELVEGVVSSAEAATELLENEIEEYATRKQGLLDFRTDLERFLATNKGDKPLIFIIDELDRCRPNYAVEVLEHMKHFFTVNGIIFVLSIDKVQLGHAVRGVYGSEQLNADEYLRRFIDLEYSIPQPELNDFVPYLYRYYNFDRFFKSKERQMYPNARQNSEALISLAIGLFREGKPTLRQQEKIFAHARLALKTVSYHNFFFPYVFIFLVYLRVMDNGLYRSIIVKKIALQDLADRFGSVINLLELDDNYRRNFLYMQAQLVHLYNNYLHKYSATELVVVDESGKAVSSIIETRLYDSKKQNLFVEVLHSIGLDSDQKHVSLEDLLKKIDLLEPVIT
jgi:thymidylate kinase